MTLRHLPKFVSMCLWLVAQNSAAAEVPTIMPLGDSITAGWNQPSYRLPLSRALEASDCVVDFVGNQTLTSRTPQSPQKYPGLHFPAFSADSHPGYDAEEHWDPGLGDDTDHAGYPGARARDLLKMTWVEVRHSQPDYVLLHVGTNDIIQAINMSAREDWAQFSIETVGTINEIIKAVFSSHKHPQNTRILLANLIPSKPEESERESVNSLDVSNTLSRYITALVEGKKDPRLLLVDVASGFDIDSMTTDGINPNAAGEKHIANAFLATMIETGLCKP